MLLFTRYIGDSWLYCCCNACPLPTVSSESAFSVIFYRTILNAICVSWRQDD